MFLCYNIYKDVCNSFKFSVAPMCQSQYMRVCVCMCADIIHYLWNIIQIVWQQHNIYDLRKVVVVLIVDGGSWTNFRFKIWNNRAIHISKNTLHFLPSHKALIPLKRLRTHRISFSTVTSSVESLIESLISRNRRVDEVRMNYAITRATLISMI